MHLHLLLLAGGAVVLLAVLHLDAVHQHLWRGAVARSRRKVDVAAVDQLQRRREQPAAEMPTRRNVDNAIFSHRGSQLSRAATERQHSAVSCLPAWRLLYHCSPGDLPLLGVTNGSRQWRHTAWRLRPRPL